MSEETDTLELKKDCKTRPKMSEETDCKTRHWS